jgi:hypothetical protein
MDRCDVTLENVEELLEALVLWLCEKKDPAFAKTLLERAKRVADRELQ